MEAAGRALVAAILISLINLVRGEAFGPRLLSSLAIYFVALWAAFGIIKKIGK